MASKWAKSSLASILASSLSMQIPPQRRPFTVTILIVVVLIFTSLNILRMHTAIRDRDFLTSLPMTVPVLYYVITGAVWGGIGVALAFGLFGGRKWSSSLAKFVTLLYTAYYWLDRLVIADRFSITSRWQFVTGLTILLAVSVFWVLKLPKTRAFLIK
jgi:hypothetical protein